MKDYLKHILLNVAIPGLVGACLSAIGRGIGDYIVDRMYKKEDSDKRKIGFV